MGWITLAQARAGAGTTANSNAAAKLVADWLDQQGAKIVTASNTVTSKAFSGHGIDCTQTRATETAEYRALARDLAEWLARWLGEDTTVEWDMFGVDANGNVHQCICIYGPPSTSTAKLAYYKGGTGNYIWTSAAHPHPSKYTGTEQIGTPGRLVTAAAERANPADGWRVVVNSSVYMCPDYSNVRTENKAFIPAVPNEAQNGIVTSRRKEKVCVNSEGTAVYQNTTTVEREYRYLTETEAAAKVTSESSQASKTYDARVRTSWSTGGAETYKNVTVRGGGADGRTAATDKVAVSRPMENGYYVVTVTETTYQATTT